MSASSSGARISSCAHQLLRAVRGPLTAAGHPGARGPGCRLCRQTWVAPLVPARRAGLVHACQPARSGGGRGSLAWARLTSHKGQKREMLKSGCWLPAHTHAPTAAVHAPHRTRCPSPHGAPRSGQERGPRRVDFSSQGRRGTPSAQTLHLQPNPTNPHTAGESRPSRGESSGTWASSSSGSATEKRPQARCCATRCCATRAPAASREGCRGLI